MAKEMGVTPQAINSLKKGGIGIRSIKKLSLSLNIDEIELLTVDTPQNLTRPIPIISWANARYFTKPLNSWPTEVPETDEPVSYCTLGPLAFGLRVDGDSMSPRYLHGDIIIIDPEVTPDNGSACIATINGEVTFRLFWEYETEIRLQPLNDHYPDIIVRKDSRADFKVIGKIMDIKAKI